MTKRFAATSRCAALWALALTRAAHADPTLVQIPVDALLDGRPVTTLTNNALVPWTVGIDKDDGFITSAAASFLKQAGSALPDDGTFPANADHPEMVLHFSNAAVSTSSQARGVSGTGMFEFTLPQASYSALFLAISSSYGDSPLTVTLQYADASSTPIQFTLPDWGTGQPLPKDPPIFFNLISGLHKWNRDNASVDTPTHSLTGVKLSPAPDKPLSRVQVSKTGATPYLVFWGATGLATSTIDAGGAGGSAGSAGNSSSAGAAAVGGAAAAGSTGQAGASAGGTSASGSPGAAGATNVAGQSGATASAASSGAAGTPPSNASSDSNAGCSVVGHQGARLAWPTPAWLLALSLLGVRRRARLNSRR